MKKIVQEVSGEGDAMTKQPEIVKDEHLRFLDGLRVSGKVNMFGARPYLADHFGLDKNDSAIILKNWMDSFDERAKSQPGGGK